MSGGGTSYPPGKGANKWTDEHTKIMVAGIIAEVQASRSKLYALPGIVGEVDGHGNNMTLQKMTQLLEGFARANGVDPAIVKESRKGARGGGSGTKGKRKSDDDGGSGKKAKKGKKVKEELEELED